MADRLRMREIDDNDEGDTFAVMHTLETASPANAVIIGAGYVGLEMAEALTARGLAVTQLEQLPEVLATADPELGALVRAELAAHGVEVMTGTTTRQISRAAPAGPARLRVAASGPAGETITRLADMVLVVTGVRPATGLAVAAGARSFAAAGTSTASRCPPAPSAGSVPAA